MESHFSIYGYLEEALSCMLFGVLAGLTVGLGHWMFEEGWYFALTVAEKNGYIHKLAPSIHRSFTQYRRESFIAVALPHALFFVVLSHFRQALLSHADIKFDVWEWWKFTWAVMVIHDAWFYMVHSILHKIKYIYMHIHRLHHASGGDLTVFSTAFGDATDIGIVFTSFYAILFAWIYHQPSWNPLCFLFLGWAFNSVNLMGHCGYDLPVWVCGMASLGILFTPMAQRPKHHYIHHLDPRFNRSLYFTWWDRLFRTYSESHHKLKETLPFEQQD